MGWRAPGLTTTSLAASALVLLASLARLPPLQAVAHPPATPYDRSPARHVAPAFILLEEAAAVIPRGPTVTVTVTSEPPDPRRDTESHHIGVALLPGREVVPAALWGAPRPDLAGRADYIVILGERPAVAPGRLLLESPRGTVWQRRPS